MQDLLIERHDYILPIDEINKCPKCDNLLTKADSVIKLYGKSDVDEGEFVSNKSGSHFCPNCPVVVFEKETVEEAITLGLRIKEWFKYCILGFVDLDAVPVEKRHLSLGTDENPYPMVSFLAEDNTRKTISPPSKKIDKFGDLKIGRNEKCPCGSGKKYKKCCL